MPVVQGYHVPEIENHRVRPNEFNVLLLDLTLDQINTISIHVAMLHDYLDTLGLSSNRIKLHVAASTKTQSLASLEVMNTALKVHEINIELKGDILELASTIDADILLDEIERFTKKEIFKNNDRIAIAHFYNPHFNDLLNSICTGWNIAWNFRDPIWNASWLTNYLELGSLAKKLSLI